MKRGNSNKSERFFMGHQPTKLVMVTVTGWYGTKRPLQLLPLSDLLYFPSNKNLNLT
jgi:hypothetical protein